MQKLNKEYYFVLNKWKNNNFTDYDLNRLIKKCIYLVKDDEENNSYLKLLANLYIEKKEYNKAKQIFFKMLQINEKNSAAYYGLFKIDIFLNDDENLLYDLHDYEDNLQKGELSMSLLYDVVNLYLDLKENVTYDYEFNYENKFLSNKCENEEINELMNAYVTALKIKDYKQALMLINKCDEINKDENCYLSIAPFCYLTKKICELSKINEKNNLENEKKEAIKNKDYNLYTNMCHLQLISNKYKLDEMLKDINTLIDIKEFSLAKRLLDVIKDRIVTKDHKLYYKYISSKYDEMSVLTYEEIEYIEYARNKIANKEYFDALFYLERGQKINNNNIFNYYIGKCYEKLHFDVSIDYLNKYNKKGGSQLHKSYFYMALIYLSKRQYKNCSIYYDKFKKILRFFYLCKGENYDLDDKIYNLNDKENNYDFRKQKDIKLSLNDFK